MLDKSVRIGIISTQYGPPTPPVNYGGMERVNFFVGNKLAEWGYDVTLFAPCNDSMGVSYLLNGGKTIATPGGGEIRPREGGEIPPFASFMQQHRNTCDVWHDSSHHHSFAAGNEDLKFLLTIHNPNLPEARNAVMISNAMKDQLGQQSAPVVYNGVPSDMYPFCPDKEDFLLYIGYIAPHKGVHLACEVAERLGKKIILAGHFHEDSISTIQPFIDRGVAQAVGLVAGAQKMYLLSHAKVGMFPAQWPEPGNMAALEVMAVGTPIVSTSRGCFPEYVTNGVNGFIADKVDGMCEAVNKIDQIDPAKCRQVHLDKFTVEQQTRGYLALYEKALGGERW